MADGVTYQSLKRLSKLPSTERPAEYSGGEVIAGQQWDDVLIGGGQISNVNLGPLDNPLSISDGGTGQTTANGALNALLPSQSGNSGKVLKTDGSNASWSSDTDTGITQLTGDVTAGPGSGSQAATLATVNANIGSFGSSTSIPSLTVNGKGLVTAVSGNAVIAPAGTLTGSSLASGVTSSSLTQVGTVTSGTWSASFGAVSGANLTSLTAANISAGTAGINITGNAATVTTNANLTGAITSTGNATSLGSFTSAQLAAAITNETGTGAAVFGTTPTLSQPDIIGTTTNNNANPGSVGEFISSTVLVGSAVSLTTGVDANVTSISLTAGDWDVWGNIVYTGTGTATAFYAWTSATSATFPTLPNNGAFSNIQGISSTGSFAILAGYQRISLSTTTTVYLSTEAAFSGGTKSAYGFIGARRRR